MPKKIERLSSRTARARKLKKTIVITELRQKYSLKDLLKLSGLARSTYYYRLKRGDTDKNKHKAIKADIRDIFSKNKGRYWYRRITDALREKGYIINHKTILKLMCELGLRGKQGKNTKNLFS